MAPRWPKTPLRCPRWPQDGRRETPKLASRVSEVRILKNRLCRHRSTLQEGPKWPWDGSRRPKTSQDGPRWPEEGPKMEPRWRPKGVKMARKSAPGPLSYVAELQICPECPKWSKLASRVSELRFLAELGSTFAVRQQYQNSPPL